MTRTIAVRASLAALGAIALVAGSAAAQGDASPPTFLIERIVVEGGRRSSQKIVASETLLTPGRSYTETELREGLQRVARLPFVVQADFSLRRGSERGRFELVISVTEAKPIFVGGYLEAIVRDGVCCDRGSLILDSDGPGLGARLFFGGQSELSAGLGGVGYSSVEGGFVLGNVAYTYHNLFGKQVVGTLAFQTRYRSSIWSGQLALPLGRANVLTLAADRPRRKISWLELARPESPYASHTAQATSSRVSLLWQRDTTDDPFTPRRGSRFAAGLAYADSDYGGTVPWFPERDGFEYVDVAIDGHERAWSGSLQASRYWPLSRRLSLGVGGSLAGSVAPAHAGVDLDGRERLVQMESRNASGKLGVTLIGTFPERRSALPQFWWTVGASLSDLRRWRACDAQFGCGVMPPLADWAFGESDDLSRAELAPGDDSRSLHAGVSASIAARGRWGTVAFTFSYRHYFVDRARWR